MPTGHDPTRPMGCARSVIEFSHDRRSCWAWSGDVLNLMASVGSGQYFFEVLSFRGALYLFHTKAYSRGKYKATRRTALWLGDAMINTAEPKKRKKNPTTLG